MANWHKINILQWPSQSPDPNENIWFVVWIEEGSPQEQMKDIKDLGRFCMEEWSKIPLNVFSNLTKRVLKTGVPIFYVFLLFNVFLNDLLNKLPFSEQLY
jgi:hypothetical protein